jgi:hypothetical protein
MNRKWFPIVSVLLATLSLGLGGCQSMKAEPSKGAGFVPMDEMSYRADLPFNKVWAKPGVDWTQYKTIYITEVNTRFLMETNWWQKSLRRNDMEKDARHVAQYMQEKFKEAFRKDSRNRFVVIDSPQPGSLTLELALTELIPSHPVMEAMSVAAPYGSGVVVRAATKKSGAKATVAFEGRIVDTSSGTVLAMVADREQGKTAPVNLRALTWYGEADSIIDEWADQFIHIANRHPGEIIKDSSPFTLKPW